MLKLQYFGHLMWRTNSLENDAGKDWRQEKKGTSEDEVVRWHHQLNGHESEQGPRDSVGQGSQACCSSWGRKELETTEQLNNSKVENLSHHLVPSHIIYSSPESEEPSRHSASLLVVEREKWNNLSRSLDFWKRYWYARPLNIHEAYLLPFIVCVPYQILQHNSLLHNHPVWLTQRKQYHGSI